MHTLIHNDTPLVNATELAPSTGKRKIRVLHVDDEHCLLEVSKQILALDNDFEIDVATSVDEAFKKLATETYDAIISDHEMPQKTVFCSWKNCANKKTKSLLCSLQEKVEKN